MIKYVQFIFDITIDGILFTRMSFYCHVSTSLKIVDCNSCDRENEYKQKEFYILKRTIEGEEVLFEVSEDNAFITTDCPNEMYMDIDKHIENRRLDNTADVFKAVKKATGHDMTVGWFGQEAWSINDVMGIKHGRYGGTPIDNTEKENNIKKTEKGKDLG